MESRGSGPFDSGAGRAWWERVEAGEATVRGTLERFLGGGGEAPAEDEALAACALVAAALDASCDGLVGDAMPAVRSVADSEPEDIAEHKRLAAEAVPRIARSAAAAGREGDADRWSALRRIAHAVGANIEAGPAPHPDGTGAGSATPDLDAEIGRARMDVVAAAGAGSRPAFDRAAAVYVHALLRRASAADPSKSAPPFAAFAEEFEGSAVTQQLWEAAQGDAAATLITMLSMLEQQF